MSKKTVLIGLACKPGNGQMNSGEFRRNLPMQVTDDELEFLGRLSKSIQSFAVPGDPVILVQPLEVVQ
jgi:hypothetical protein